MSELYYILIPAAVVVATALIIYAAVSSKKRKENKPKVSGVKAKDRAAIVREANRRLSQNPRDGEALKSLADLYYQD